MKIRNCTIDDFRQVYALLPQLWPDVKLNRNRLRHAFERALAARHQHYLCAVEKEIIVGFCSLSIRTSLWQQGSIAHIDEIVVAKAHRGNGIGADLMAKALQIAQKEGCYRIELDSAFRRRRSHDFYGRLGFERRAYLFSKSLK